MIHNENNVETLLAKDGVDHVDFTELNQEVISIPLLEAENKHHKSWSRRLVNTVNGSAVIISQSPGEGNRQHYHPDYNEWWYIYNGEYDLFIGENKRKTRIKKGDFVFMEAGKKHQMRAAGDKPAIRIGFSHSMATHTYVD
jgi:quercetin dioxygenase-like cupin family protein